jgi:hypothetical protein
MKKDKQNKRDEKSSKSWGETRRDFIKKPLALAAGSILMPSLLGSRGAEAKTDKHDDVTIAPRYYPGLSHDPMKTKTSLLHHSLNIPVVATVIAGIALALLPLASRTFAEDRSYDGSGNNFAHPEWGAPAPYDRLAANAYADGIASPARSTNQSARAISNIVNDQTTSIPSKQNLSDLWQAFTSILATDFAIGASNPADPFFIPVPPGDPVFSGVPVLPFFRGIFVSAPALTLLPSMGKMRWTQNCCAPSISMTKAQES